MYSHSHNAESEPLLQSQADILFKPSDNQTYNDDQDRQRTPATNPLASPWHHSINDLADVLQVDLKKGLSSSQAIKQSTNQHLSASEFKPKLGTRSRSPFLKYAMINMLICFTGFMGSLVDWRVGRIVTSDLDGLWVSIFLSIHFLCICVLVHPIERSSSRKHQQAIEQAIDRSIEQSDNRICKVVRDGEQERLSSSELVIGDVIELTVGDCVPVDCRLIDCSMLCVDESGVTGRSGWQTKYGDIIEQPIKQSYNQTNNQSNNQPVNPSNNETNTITINKLTLEHIMIHPELFSNMLWCGSNVVQGRARALIISSGDRTFVNQSIQAARRSNGQLINQSTKPASDQAINPLLQLSTFFTVLALISMVSYYIASCSTTLQSPGYVSPAFLFYGVLPIGLLVLPVFIAGIFGLQTIDQKFNTYYEWFAVMCMFPTQSSMFELARTSVMLIDHHAIRSKQTKQSTNQSTSQLEVSRVMVFDRVDELVNLPINSMKTEFDAREQALAAGMLHLYKMSDEHCVSCQVLLLSVAYFTRYCSADKALRDNTKAVSIANSCLVIAYKQCNNSSMAIQVAHMNGDCDEQQVRSKLNHQLNLLTMFDFHQRICDRGLLNEREQVHNEYLLEIFAANSFWSNFRPSALASFAAFETLTKMHPDIEQEQLWTEKHVNVTGYTMEDVRVSYTAYLDSSFITFKNSPLSSHVCLDTIECEIQVIIKRKYRKRPFGDVILIPSAEFEPVPCDLYQTAFQRMQKQLSCTVTNQLLRTVIMSSPCISEEDIVWDDELCLIDRRSIVDQHDSAVLHAVIESHVSLVAPYVFQLSKEHFDLVTKNVQFEEVFELDERQRSSTLVLASSGMFDVEASQATDSVYHVNCRGTLTSILSVCTHARGPKGDVYGLDETIKQQWLDHCQALTTSEPSTHVVAFASRLVSSFRPRHDVGRVQHCREKSIINSASHFEQDMVFEGSILFRDELCWPTETCYSILQTAGIKMKVMSCDSIEHVNAVAQPFCLVPVVSNCGPPVIETGPTSASPPREIRNRMTMDQMEELEWFADMSVVDKEQLVRAHQSLHECILVVGNGFDDVGVLCVNHIDRIDATCDSPMTNSLILTGCSGLHVPFTCMLWSRLYVVELYAALRYYLACYISLVILLMYGFIRYGYLPIFSPFFFVVQCNMLLCGAFAFAKRPYDHRDGDVLTMQPKKFDLRDQVRSKRFWMPVCIAVFMMSVIVIVMFDTAVAAIALGKSRNLIYHWSDARNVGKIQSIVTSCVIMSQTLLVHSMRAYHRSTIIDSIISRARRVIQLCKRSSDQSPKSITDEKPEGWRFSACAMLMPRPRIYMWVAWNCFMLFTVASMSINQYNNHDPETCVFCWPLPYFPNSFKMSGFIMGPVLPIPIFIAVEITKFLWSVRASCRKSEDHVDEQET